MALPIAHWAGAEESDYCLIALRKKLEKHRTVTSFKGSDELSDFSSKVDAFSVPIKLYFFFAFPSFNKIANFAGY